MGYLNEIKKLPKPTNIQFNRFIEHIQIVHNWYKHLSLIQGGEFVVFLDKKAGRNYPIQNPKLPFGNTCDGYVKAFGFLTYAYKTNLNSKWNIDYDVPADEIINELPDFIVKKCTFTLYPYVSEDFIESINFHKAEFSMLRNGFFHPQSKLLQSLEVCDEKLSKIWGGFSDEDMNKVLHFDNSQCNEKDISKDIKEYIKIEKLQVKYLDELKSMEEKKIMYAINQLNMFLNDFNS